jgi:hypothetical protein
MASLFCEGGWRSTRTRYDPVARADRIFDGRGAPDLVIDCLDRDKSCLDLQMLAEAAANSRTCEAIIKVKVSKLKRGRRQMAEKDRVEKLEAAIWKIRAETFKPRQTAAPANQKTPVLTRTTHAYVLMGAPAPP